MVLDKEARHGPGQNFSFYEGGETTLGLKSVTKIESSLLGSPQMNMPGCYFRKPSIPNPYLHELYCSFTHT